MSQTRLNARAFQWARRQAIDGTKNSLNAVIKFYENTLGLAHLSELDGDFNHNNAMCLFKECAHNYFTDLWYRDLNRIDARNGVGQNKLRTYRLFKTDFATAPYLENLYLTQGQTSALAKFRCGVAPIRLETGRYERLRLEERVCQLCDTGEIESELHVITKCNLYNDIRTELYNNVSTQIHNFQNMSDEGKLKVLLSDGNICKFSAKACSLILSRRRHHLYL
jgi:hypothetical protein